MTIEQLEAEVIRLRAECFALAAGACGGHYGDDYGYSRCSLVDAQRTRAEAAETRAEALASEVFQLRTDNERLSQRVENLREALGDMLDDCEPDRPGAPRLSIREAARAALEDDA